MTAPEHTLGRLREQMQIALARASALRDAADGIEREQPEDPVAYLRTVAQHSDVAGDLLIELITERGTPAAESVLTGNCTCGREIPCPDAP